jgi:hypothetical protein
MKKNIKKMTYIMKSVLTVVVILTFATSCNNINRKPYNIFEEHERETVLYNKISQITEIEIGLDTAGNSQWKRISSTKLYDKKGFIIETITPEYMTRPWPKSSPGGMTIDEMSYHTQMSETNIPNGKADTTYFNYDERGNLNSIKNRYLTTYKYDEYNNLTEKCVTSDYTETVCNIKSYEYDKNNRIISIIDSAGVMSSTSGRKRNIPANKSIFKYDNAGRVIFDGKYKRIFNNKDQLIEVKDFNQESNSFSDKYVFTYDSENRKVSEEFTKVVSSSWNPETNIVSNIKTAITKKYLYYNDRGLLKQEKTLDKNDKLISLMNYEYLFY